MLNFTPPNFQILVGNLDVTNSVKSVSINRNQWSIGKPIYWSGNIELYELDAPFKLAESLDDWINKARWARGQIVQIRAKNTLICTLRIASYFYNEDERNSTIEVSQLLDLLDYDNKPKDYSGLDFPPDRAIALPDLVERLIREAGIINFYWGISGVFNRDFVPPNLTGGSCIALASKYLNERGIWLYHQPNEAVTVTRYPMGIYNGIINFKRARNEIEDFKRSLKELPCNVVMVTGGGETFGDCEKDDETLVEVGYGTAINITIAGTSSAGYPNYRKTTEPTDTGKDNLSAIAIKIERSIGSLLPNGEVPKWIGNIQSLIETERTKNRKYYDGQGRLTKEETITDVMRWALFNGMEYLFFMGDFAFKNKAKGVTITYSSYLPNEKKQFSGRESQEKYESVIRQKRYERYEPFLRGTVEILPDDFDWRENRPSSRSVYKPLIEEMIAELVVETWVEMDKNKECGIYKYDKKVFKRKQGKRLEKNWLNTGEDRMTWIPGGLIQDTANSKTSLNVIPPNWETAPPLNPTHTINISIEKNFDTPGINWQNANEENKRRLEYQCTTLLTKTEGEFLAEFLGRSQLQRYYAREVSMPLLDCDEFINDPTPFRRAYLHQGSYILSAESINIVNDEAELAFIGLFERPLSFPYPDRNTLFPPPPPEGEPEPEPTPVPVETVGFPVRNIYRIPVQVELTQSSESIGEFQSPNLDNIVVSDGNIAVNNGFVETNGGYHFREIITFENKVLIYQDNVLYQSTSPFNSDFWDSILTMDGEEITLDGKVLT
jgi:hypothetical protein